LVPESSKVSVAQWYRQAFSKTHVQTRYPGSNAIGFGLYDGSLAHYTLDGAANGGQIVDWFQYPQMIKANQTAMWKSRMMGGETYPDLQPIIFNSTYPARTAGHQDFKDCIDALHLSYVVHHGAFQNGYTGEVLQKANMMHVHMGYAFYVSKVTALKKSTASSQSVDVSVLVTQVGVAPFYYDLQLVLKCRNGLVNMTLPGVNEIIEKNESRIFLFRNVPATTVCLSNVSLSLQSSYAYPGRPIKFAQGTTGDVTIRVPVPALL
jgi:hypothetical protein